MNIYMLIMTPTLYTPLKYSADNQFVCAWTRDIFFLLFYTYFILLAKPEPNFTVYYC